MKQFRSKSHLSYKVCINSSFIRKDGSSSIVLRVIQDRVKKDINLNIHWPAKHFDEQEQRCLSRFSGDKADLTSINILIEDAKSRASRIVLRYYALEKSLNLELFTKEFNEYRSREKVLNFWEGKTEQQYSDKIISYETYRRHKTSRLRFLKFVKNKDVLFTELTLDLIKKYDHYLRKTKKYAHNTVCGFHKDLKTCINAAIEPGTGITNPYNKFSYSYRAGERAVLDMEELRRLRDLVDTPKVTATENEILKGFLFSCYTGLRVSDNRALTSDMIENGLMTVNMKKGAKFGKQVTVPLPEYAKKLIAGRTGKIFNVFAEKTRNETLKILAVKAEISKHLTFHVSRDTFGTIFVELGGDPVTLKELMGHTNIATTMIYVKISQQRKVKLMANFDTMH